MLLGQFVKVWFK